MMNITRRYFIETLSHITPFILLPLPLYNILSERKMKDNHDFDVIIIGGSYAGLAAGMALGRALVKVLIIDDGRPCNRQTPQSHNFLTNDGKSPATIATIAREQVARYDTVQFFQGTAIGATRLKKGFEMKVTGDQTFTAAQLIFATGISDSLPGIVGIEECWGISVLHCPYCHGYEVKRERTGIIANGDIAYDFVRLITNWTKELTLFTNGKAQLSSAQRADIQRHRIEIIEKEIDSLQHDQGQLKNILFKDGSSWALNVLYAPSPFEQHCKIPEALGCELTSEGYLKVDEAFETPIKGVFAIGDSVSKMRTVANAVATGTAAGMMLSKKMILERF